MPFGKKKKVIKKAKKQDDGSSLEPIGEGIYRDANSGRILVAMEYGEYSPWINFLKRVYGADVFDLNKFGEQFGIRSGQGVIEGVAYLVEPEHLILGMQGKHEQYYGLTEIKADAELRAKYDELSGEVDGLRKVKEDYIAEKEVWTETQEKCNSLEKELTKTQEKLGGYEGDVSELRIKYETAEKQLSGLQVSKEELEGRIQKYFAVNMPDDYTEKFESLGYTQEEYIEDMEYTPEEEQLGYHVWAMINMFKDFIDMFESQLRE